MTNFYTRADRAPSLYLHTHGLTRRYCSVLFSGHSMPHVAPRAALGRRARTESTHIAAAMNLAGAISVRNSTAAPSRTQLMIRESGATVRPLKVIISGLCDS